MVEAAAAVAVVALLLAVVVFPAWDLAAVCVPECGIAVWAVLVEEWLLLRLEEV